MKSEQFLLLQEQLFEDALSLGISKGNEYAGEDRFANFITAAELSGITVPQSIMNYFIKHVRSISKFVIKNGEMVMNEPFRERVIDAINYLVILNAWYTQEEWNAEKREAEGSCGSGQSVQPVHPCEGRGECAVRESGPVTMRTPADARAVLDALG